MFLFGIHVRSLARKTIVCERHISNRKNIDKMSNEGILISHFSSSLNCCHHRYVLIIVILFTIFSFFFLLVVVDDDIPRLIAENCKIESDSSDDDDEQWMEEDEENHETRCLFTNKVFASIEEAIEFLKINFNFDLCELKRKHEMDFYSYIKVRHIVYLKYFLVFFLYKNIFCSLSISYGRKKSRHPLSYMEKMAKLLFGLATNS